MKGKRQSGNIEGMVDEIETLISHIEDAYRQSSISERAYRTLKGTNIKRLEAIKLKLGKAHGKGKQEG